MLESWHGPPHTNKVKQYKLYCPLRSVCSFSLFSHENKKEFRHNEDFFLLDSSLTHILLHHRHHIINSPLSPSPFVSLSILSLLLSCCISLSPSGLVPHLGIMGSRPGQHLCPQNALSLSVSLGVQFCTSIVSFLKCTIISNISNKKKSLQPIHEVAYSKCVCYWTGQQC